jgi:hypothetical protein
MPRGMVRRKVFIGRREAVSEFDASLICLFFRRSFLFTPGFFMFLTSVIFVDVFFLKVNNAEWSMSTAIWWWREPCPQHNNTNGVGIAVCKVG